MGVTTGGGSGSDRSRDHALKVRTARVLVSAPRPLTRPLQGSLGHLRRWWWFSVLLPAYHRCPSLPQHARARARHHWLNGRAVLAGQSNGSFIWFPWQQLIQVACSFVDACLGSGSVCVCVSSSSFFWGPLNPLEPWGLLSAGAPSSVRSASVAGRGSAVSSSSSRFTVRRGSGGNVPSPLTNSFPISLTEPESWFPFLSFPLFLPSFSLSLCLANPGFYPGGSGLDQAR